MYCRLQKDGVFKWDTNKQGVILASFYYGYVLTPFVSAVLAMKFGGKLLMLVGQIVIAVLTVLTPVLTTVGGFPVLVVVRVLEGVGQVCILPNVFAFIFNFICIFLLTPMRVWELSVYPHLSACLSARLSQNG